MAVESSPSLVVYPQLFVLDRPSFKLQQSSVSGNTEIETSPFFIPIVYRNIKVQAQWFPFQKSCSHAYWRMNDYSLLKEQVGFTSLNVKKTNPYQLGWSSHWLIQRLVKEPLWAHQEAVRNINSTCICEYWPIFAHSLGVQICNAYESAKMQISTNIYFIIIELANEARQEY